VGSRHLERTALIYIRQSTMAQVREHTESTARQYALAEEAARLGWLASRVEVIDADLGVSGRSVEGRDGFKGLVARVCLGEIGAIFGLEVSRLARSSADLSRLLEYARLTDTLVIDADGVYDLAEFNDRLLLGLKGTMSEAELHLLAGRLQGAKRAAAERGELRTPLPIGYVYDDEGQVVLDPDEEVATAIADVFTAFTATGSAYQVVAAFADRRFPRRAYGGAWAGRVQFGRLTHSRVLGILANPVYAGAYVFGRYRSRRVVNPDGSVRTATTQRPRAEWGVCIQDHHPAYISWDQFLANEARLAANRTNAGAPPAPGRLRAVSGHRVLRVVRPGDVDPLRRRAAVLRVRSGPRRPRGHPELPVGALGHRGRGGHRRTARRGQPRPGRVGTGRRGRSDRTADPVTARGRADRGTRPLRRRARRAGAFGL
jgi:DNA invertase Pin-like site-specific DNA recombinase